MENFKFKLIFITFFLVTFAQQAPAKNYTLQPNGSINIKIQPDSEIRIKGGRFIHWADQTNYLKVTGLKPGTARIFQTGQLKATINVIPSSIHKTYSEVRHIMKGMMGPKIYLDKNKIFISGVFYRVSDWKKISQVFKKNRENYQFVGQFSSDKISKLKEYTQTLLSNYHHLEPKIETISPLVISRLKKENYIQFDQLFKKYGFKVVENTNEKSNYQIKYHLHFYEVTENLIDSWGVKFEGGLSAQLLTGFENLTQLNAFMDQAITTGTVKLVSKNTITCTANTTCSFSDGGELPIKSSGFGVSRVTWKQYGIKFDFKSKIEKEKNIRYSVNYHASFPDTSLSTDGVPGLKIKKLETSILAKNEQPVLLTNLEFEKSSFSKKGLSPFNRIPLLNMIINNKTQDNTQTKLALFVTSKILE